MLEFQLFRIQIFKYSSLPLFNQTISQNDIPVFLENIITAYPSFESKKKIVWRIGNVEKFDKDGIYFRIGKITKSTFELFRDNKFIEQELETSPYTHVILDPKLEICAIAKNLKLSPTPKGIANNLIRVFNNAKYTKDNHLTFYIKEILDPEPFIEILKSAYEILSFKFNFIKPNAFDAHKDFEMPLKNLLKETSAEKGKLEMSGKKLKLQTLEEITRSVVSTGNEVSAKVKLKDTDIVTTKRISKNPIIIRINHLNLMDILNKARNIYHKIRGNNEA